MRISSRATLSTVLPYCWALAPQELLPTIPPILQWLCVAGCGPNFSPCSASWRLRSSSAIPGSTTQVRARGSTETSLLLLQSRTTAAFVHWPPRLVPPPRDRTGASWRRQTATARAPASTVRGTTTPMGTWR
nr:hypothetical protein [Saccharopolyspora sp. ASAGF58]